MHIKKIGSRELHSLAWDLTYHLFDGITNAMAILKSEQGHNIDRDNQKSI